MKEIIELNEDQLKELENEIREEMMKREVSVRRTYDSAAGNYPGVHTGIHPGDHTGTR